ncbi:MAG: hypothetical protein DMF91_21245 [Acidobacteria bacterium]|nr:MAG: hypothetical protein DMF91_21245 [Acidobacteriota bacterium]
MTGVRQDRWANAHRVPVEEAKPEGERGFYLHPDVFAQPDDMKLPASRAQAPPGEIKPTFEKKP